MVKTSQIGKYERNTMLRLFFLSLFHYLILRKDRDRVEEGQREREGERENPKEAPHCQYRARCRAQSHER